MRPDIVMRGVDGYEVAQRLRKAEGPRPWLVAMTGQADAERARTAGFHRMLAKPFRLEELDAVVQEYPAGD